MRRLSWLVLATLIALWAQQLLRNPDVEAGIALRDGLLLSLLAGILFAAQAMPPPRPRTPPVSARWPLTGRVLFAAGILLGLTGTLLLARGVDRGASLALPGLLWLLGVLLLGAGVFWPSPTTRYPRPSARWSVDAAGRFVRMALQGQRQPLAQDPLALNPRTVTLTLAGITLLAGVLRLWKAATLPPGCSDPECAAGLQALTWSLQPSLTGLFTSPSPAFTLLLGGLARLTEPGLGLLRWTAALLGLATVPLAYAATRRFLRPATGLLLAALLALSPWHIRASRGISPELLLVLLLFLLFWLLSRARDRGDRRSWFLVGLVAGLAAYALPLFALPILVWSVLALPRHRRAASIVHELTGLVVLGPLALIQLTRLPGPHLTQLGERLDQLIAALLRQGSLLAPGFLDTPLLAPLTGALFLLGLLASLRYLRQDLPRLLLLGTLLLGGWCLLFSEKAVDLAGPLPLLPLLPVIFLAAALALDLLVQAIGAVWTGLLSPRTVLNAGLVLLLAGMALPTLGLLGDLDDPALLAAQNVPRVRLGEYLARILAEAPPPASPGTPLRVLLPPADLAHPATRLAGGPALLVDSSALQPLDPAQHIPYAQPLAGDLRYVVPGDDRAVDGLLRQVYLGAPVEELWEPETGQLLYTIFHVPQELATQIQGLPGRYFPGEQPGSGEPALLRQDGPLRFDWASQPPLRPPFAVTWRGSLLVPEYGEYTFQAQAGDATFSLELDDELLLESSLGMTEQRRTLAQGLYRLEMGYRSGPTAQDLAVTWRKPGGETEVIPRQALYNLALPTAGLLATYYASDDWTGPILTQRREPVLQPDPTLARPFSVTWVGKLAAPVDGEYGLALSSDGFATLAVDGQPLLALAPDPVQLESGLPGFQEGAIYLTQGWHDLELRYRPVSDTPTVHLLWQPPGQFLDELSSSFLVPLPPEAATDNLTLPVLPPPQESLTSADPTAVPRPAPGSLPENTAPPSGLPELPMEQVWQVGDVCGPGDEQFQQPRGVAVDGLSGRVTVADAGNQRLVVRELADGSLVHILQGEAYQEPFDLALSATGELYVLDAAAQQILRLDPLGPVPGIVPLETAFYHPRGLATTPDGDLLVADTGGARVVMVTTGGKVLAQFGGPDTPLGQGQPVDVLGLSNGGFWAVTAEDGRLWRVESGEGFVAVARANTFDAPHLAGLPTNGFFLTDPERSLVLFFDATGRPLAQFGGPGAFQKPVGIAAALVDDQVLVAVSDSAACTVSLWRTPLENVLPTP